MPPPGTCEIGTNRLHQWKLATVMKMIKPVGSDPVQNAVRSQLFQDSIHLKAKRIPFFKRESIRVVLDYLRKHHNVGAFVHEESSHGLVNGDCVDFSPAKCFCHGRIIVEMQMGNVGYPFINVIGKNRAGQRCNAIR